MLSLWFVGKRGLRAREMEDEKELALGPLRTSSCMITHRKSDCIPLTRTPLNSDRKRQACPGFGTGNVGCTT